MSIEDQIGVLSQQKKENPFGWLICFEGRPLQGIPPKGKGPHILFFSIEGKAHSFIADRKKYYGEEPLSTVCVDSEETLKALALGPSNDARYVAPPCGIIFDFDYPTKKARKVFPPADVNRMLPAEIARACRLASRQVAAVPVGPMEAKPETVKPAEPPASASTPAPATAPVQAPKAVSAVPAQPRRNRPLTITLITCGSLLAIGLILLCLGGGAWYGMSRGVIAVPAFLDTRTPVPTLTLTPTPTQTPVPWDVHIIDDFSSNVNSWPLGDDNGQYGSSLLNITGGKLHLDLNATQSWASWWNPYLPAVSDFDVAVDAQRTAGVTTGDYGIILRFDPNANSFYYLGISDTNQKVAFFVFQANNWSTITDWTYNSAILPGQVNRIEAVGKGYSFTFLINGVEVGQAEDGRLASGQMGILADLYNAGDQVTVEYDNLDYRGNK